MARILGLTGNIACGKTTVGHFLLALGAERYLDADALVHQLYLPGQPIALLVAEAFGPTMLTDDGSVDRKALGNLVFYDTQAMQRLEQIVHPAVHRSMQTEISRVSPAGIIILDAVKLLEGGAAAFCQSKWLVLCPPEQALARLMVRNSLSREEASARLQAQPDRQTALSLVDEVIMNDGTLEHLHQQVITAFERFIQKFPD